MSILCHGDCHVFLGASSICTCEAEKAAQLIGNYYPYFPSRPPTPPTAGTKDSQTAVPLSQFKAAQAVNATHLSADGKRVYCTRYGQPLEAKWHGWDGFGAWEECEAIPADAVRIE
jgi:hypothetical protein